MYFPIGWIKHLDVKQAKKYDIQCVSANRYHMLFAVVTEATISIWNCNVSSSFICELKKNNDTALFQDVLFYALKF